MESNMNRRYVVSGQNFSNSYGRANYSAPNGNRGSAQSARPSQAAQNVAFNNSSQCQGNSYSDLLHAIMEADFYAQDLKLYLDTHPEDTKAVEMYREAVRQYKATRKVFEDNYYPLGCDSAGKNGTWDWIDGNFPPEACPCSNNMK